MTAEGKRRREEGVIENLNEGGGLFNNQLRHSFGNNPKSPVFSEGSGSQSGRLDLFIKYVKIAYMTDKQMEKYFTAIQERFDEQDEELKMIKETMKTILDIFSSIDDERKDIKSSLWELDSRVRKLEHSKA